MNILQLNSSDAGGGAERVAWDLFEAMRARGHGSWMSVGIKKSRDPGVFVVPNPPPASWRFGALHTADRLLTHTWRGSWQLARGLQLLAGRKTQLARERGEELFDYVGTSRIPFLPPIKPDLIHAHNLHGFYFDLRQLPRLSQDTPFMMTLHDEWSFTGHCSYTLGCDRWQSACGECPHLDTPPAIEADGTAFNWQRKASIYAESHLHLVTPSEWLKQRVGQSMFKDRPVRVVPNGIRLDIFTPGDREEIRASLGLEPGRPVLMFSANANNPFKDFTTIEKAVERMRTPVTCLVVGGQEARDVQRGLHVFRYVPFIEDPETLARYYQAADLFLFATRADNYPLVILETLACGTPAISTKVGGIPEQIIDGKNGVLVPPGDAAAMAAVADQLLSQPERLREMRGFAAEDARARFDLNTMAERYEHAYQEICAVGSS